jgi:hypothetical protein
LLKDEVLPEGLRTGFDVGPACDPQWIFVLERDGAPVVLLVAAPAHVMVVLLRLVACGDANVGDVRHLLLGAFKMMKERGYLGYVTWVDPTRAIEQALLTLIRHSGGTQMTMPQVSCCGAF